MCYPGFFVGFSKLSRKIYIASGVLGVFGCVREFFFSHREGCAWFLRDDLFTLKGYVSRTLDCRCRYLKEPLGMVVGCGRRGEEQTRDERGLL